ncbi:REST corepressor 2-like isoform X3 [Panulirus ornatus]|uniref:REST corepressor 2-like isoform X3 n=1 Tax=Panulirus ornatus TaxID=150431 RepID=UPI003A857B69
MVTASNRNSGETKEDKKTSGPSPSNGHVSGHCDDAEKDGSESGMRVGKAFQAEIPNILPSHERRPEQCPERALLVWAPKLELNEESLEQYIWLAKDKYGYNAEQALGMLFWHRHDLEKATADLANFTPFPDEWTTEDKVLFEQAFQFHGKSFHRIRQMLPDKTIAQLVKYYYLWKKTRQRSSLIDRHARKHTAKLQQVSEGGVGDSSGDRSEEDEEGRSGEETKTCSNCTIPATVLSESPKGLQCVTCYNHWKLGFCRKMGCLRPTVGPMKRDKQLIKHKRRPPRGMHINHEVQSNKAQISGLRSKIPEDGITSLRPPAQAGPPKAKWSQDEQLLAVQAVRYFGKDFKAIAEIVGNKTENHVRSFFVTYRKRFNLDGVLREWEEEHGPVRANADE